MVNIFATPIESNDNNTIPTLESSSNHYIQIQTLFNDYNYDSSSFIKDYSRNETTYSSEKINSTNNTYSTPAEEPSDSNIVGEVPTELPLLVNKDNPIPSKFIPHDLVIPNISFANTGNIEKNHVTALTASALERMFDSALESGITLYAVSGYRSYERQSEIYYRNVEKLGQSATDKFSAKPGTSEHQTGLAMDISSRSNNYNLNESFGYTIEGKWLKNNAHKFGFILRYPEDKTDITKYSYEPWHFRYVGINVANFIYNNNLTLEEYHELNEKGVKQ